MNNNTKPTYSREDFIIDDNSTKECNIKNIDAYYDLFDEACMLLYNKTGKDYFECFLRVYNDIDSSIINTIGLDDKTIKKLEDLENKITDFYCLNEEIRQALLLVVIKAFKHKNMDLDSITPDFIGLLYAYFIKGMYGGTDKHISIMDVNLGTSNMLNIIANNNTIEADLIGVEKDEKLANLAKAFSALQGNDIRIYNNDCLDLPISANVIVGDLECKVENDMYLPYSIIINYQNASIECGMDNALMLFMVNNDFFSQKGIDVFKNEFKGTMMGLFVLPEELFKDNKIGKSILVISPKRYKDYQTLAVNIPSIKEGEKLKKSLANIGTWLKNITNGGNK